MPDDITDGETSDGSISLISGTEFSGAVELHQTPMSSLPPSPPASPLQPFWMRAHIPDLTEFAPHECVAAQCCDQAPLCCDQVDESDDHDLYDRPKQLSLSQLAENEWMKKVKAMRDREPELEQNEDQLAEVDANAPNVFNIFLYAVAGFCVVIMSVLLAHYFSSVSRINYLRSVIHGLEAENIKLQYRYIECRNAGETCDARKQATDAAAAAALADMQIANKNNAFVTAADVDAPFKQIADLTEDETKPFEPVGRKVWSSDGFVLQSSHLPPKKPFKYEDLCDKNIRDDLFSEYTSEYCEKVRHTKRQVDGKRTPVHTHQSRGTAVHNDKPIFIEDFIDPNKFNTNTYIDGQFEKFEEIDRLIKSVDFDDDEEFEYRLQEPIVVGDASFSGVAITKGYDSFEDALRKLDEHMELIEFRTNSCHTKYKKLKEIEDGKSYKKFDKSKVDKSKKKYKDDEKKYKEKDEGKKDKHHEEKKRDDKRERKEEKHDKRERKYNEKKEKNYKRD